MSVIDWTLHRPHVSFPDRHGRAVEVESFSWETFQGADADDDDAGATG